METKQQIRKRHLRDRNSISKEERKRHSDTISKNLMEYFTNIQIWKKYSIYGYYPHSSEVSLMDLYLWLLGHNVSLAFPRVASYGTMEFYKVASMEDFSKGAFDIMEPKEDCRKAEDKWAVCLVPGSVFDRSGNRYGYGKGYYDRYFSKKKGLYRIGIAFESQVETAIAAEDCDVKMHALATERTISFFENWEEEHGIIRNL